MANSLFNLQKRKRLKQSGPLQRFGPNCLGIQSTLESVRAKKGKKYEELKDNKDSDEWKSWFLNYKPSGAIRRTKKRKSASTKRKKKSRNIRSNRKL